MAKERELAGRVALVTGASRNIGRAIALALAEGGAAVVVNARRSRGEAEAVAGEIEAAGERAVALLADVTDEAAVARMVEETVLRFGGLDILVNNAAVRPHADLDDITLADFRAVLDLILEGAFICTRAALPHLRQSRAGSIVNIGGMTGHIGAAGRLAVVTGKAGLVGLTKAFAHELASAGITANCVVPGLMDTPRGGRTIPKSHLANPPLVGRLGRGEEIAAAVRFLCGPASRFTTGQAIHINGGAYMP